MTKKILASALAGLMILSSASALACNNDSFIGYDIADAQGRYGKIYYCPEVGKNIIDGYASTVEWVHAFYEAEYIDNIAKKSLIKINTPTTYFDKNGKEHPIIELTQGKKSVWNSHASQSIYSNSDTNSYQGFLTWSYLKKKFYYYYPEVYNKIISKFEELSGINNIQNKYTLIEFLEELKNDTDKWNEIIKLSKEIECAPLRLLYIGSFNSSNKTNLATLTFNTNPVYKLSLDGEIIFIFDNENDAYNLLNGNRMATFLDGGFIQVIDMLYEMDESYYLNIENFHKISIQ